MYIGARHRNQRTHLNASFPPSGCAATLGLRQASYCKLAAVAEALSRGYELVVLMDRRAGSRCKHEMAC
eukprot:4264533-Pleurochrysis_carterae.AAC.1